MLHKIEVITQLKQDILDPQGKTIHQSLQKMSFHDVKSVRVGKNIDLEIEAPSIEEAKRIATEMTEKLLYNPIMEVYQVRVR